MKRTILAAVLAGWAILPAWAQQPDDEGYAPEHGVARISLVNGDVSVRRGDSGDLTSAALNGPLVVNDHVATGRDARAEIQFDWGNMIRLAPETEVRMGELEDRRYLVQVAVGTTMFRVLRNSGADVEISTPTVSVRPVEQGSYRVTVLPDGTTEVTVRTGRAEIFTPRGSENLTAGRTMEARGSASDPEYMILAAIPQDQWDRWNADRDRDLERTQSYRYVSPDVVGAEDLDPYGRWNYDPEYGNVWVPTVDAGWAPYRVGRWVWMDYYGWTWLSDDPWGWAPYHYGNWYMSSFGWAWYPGPIGGRHYWRPALVGFFGWGSGSFNIGFGFGNVGWVPLAPRERFRPWYGRGFNNTTIVNNVTVVNNYRNARFVNGRNGVTSINAGDFGRGRRINTNNFVRATNNDLARAGTVQGRLPFNASADGRRMSDRQVNTQSLPRVNDNVRFARRGQGDNRGPSNGVAPAPRAPQDSANRGQVTRGQIDRGNNSRGNNSNDPGWRRFEGNAPNGNVVQRGQGNPTPQVNRGQIDRGQIDRGQVDRGNNSNGPGWRRFEGNAPANTPNNNRGQIDRGQVNRGNAPNGFTQAPRAPEFPSPQINRGQVDRGQIDRGQIDRGQVDRGSFPRVQQPQPRMEQPRPQEPVRISPPIVRERAPQPSVSRPEPPRGGFGQPRSEGGGGGNRGGGNPGGNRGGGGGESRGNGGGNRGGGRR